MYLLRTTTKNTMLTIQKNLSNPFYALLSLPATAMGFALSVQIATLSWILTTQYALDIHEVGIVWAAGPLAGILGQVIVGVISDDIWLWGGRRRPFILVGGTLAALSLLALPNIHIVSASLGLSGVLGVAIAVALSLDLAVNISFNPTRSIIADVTPQGNERTKGYTWMQTVSGTFGVLAYAIGSYWGNYTLIYCSVALVLLFSIVPCLFVTESPPTLAATRGDTKAANLPKSRLTFIQGLHIIRPLWGFLGYGVYALTAKLIGLNFSHYWIEFAALGITLYFVIETVLQKPSAHAVGSRGELDLVGFQKVLAAHSFSWVGIQSMFIYMVAFVQYNQPQLDSDQIGSVVNKAFLILSFVAAVLPVLLLQPLAIKLGNVKTHGACIASMAVGYGLLAVLGNSQITIFLAMAILGVGWAATISLPFAIMSERVSQERMGTYMGLFNLSVVLPQLVASLGIGLAIEAATDKNIVFYIAALCLAISAGCWLKVEDTKAGDLSSDTQKIS